MGHTQAIMKEGHQMNNRINYDYDFRLITAIVFLLSLGLIMVASSSIAIATNQFNEPLFYFWRQLVAVFIGLSLILFALKIPVHVWQTLSTTLLIFGIVLLILVLIPGVGRQINGSYRWIQLGPVSMQASEPVKLFVITYLAAYLVRQNESVRLDFFGFFRPVILLTLIAGLLLLEPDYGACVVLFGAALGMLFLAGVPAARFFAWVMVAISTLITLAILSPYRLQRLMSFTDPWQDPYDSGFQLTQALIAFGRGDWFGMGLGSSVQKLFYLPEAHTDFLFAVLAEELGIAGTVTVILVFSFIVWRAFIIASEAEIAGKLYSAYFAYGVGLIISIQVFINIGVNLGVLPTKGLTLPLMSYGGNSLVITCLMLGVLLRIDYENNSRRPVNITTEKYTYAT